MNHAVGLTTGSFLLPSQPYPRLVQVQQVSHWPEKKSMYRYGISNELSPLLPLHQSLHLRNEEKIFYYQEKCGERRMYVYWWGLPHKTSRAESKPKLPNNSLSLRPPIHHLSLAHLPNTDTSLVSGTRSGSVRRYDTRQRKPVSDWILAKEGGIKCVSPGIAEQWVRPLVCLACKRMNAKLSCYGIYSVNYSSQMRSIWLERLIYVMGNYSTRTLQWHRPLITFCRYPNPKLEQVISV